MEWLTHGNVPIDGQEYGHPGIHQPKDVGGRVEVRIDAREYDDVVTRSDVTEASDEKDADEDERIDQCQRP